jgi:hypothetical protein
MQYFTPNPFRTGYDFHKSTPNDNFLNTLPKKYRGGRVPDPTENFPIIDSEQIRNVPR